MLPSTYQPQTNQYQGYNIPSSQSAPMYGYPQQPQAPQPSQPGYGYSPQAPIGTPVFPQQPQQPFFQPQPPPPPQHHSQPSSPPSSFNNNNYLSALSASSPIGGLMAHTFEAAGANVHSRLTQYNLTLESARELFAVDAHYVKRKLGLILCPFIPRLWNQKEAHKPDLYIPLMSFITCVLILSILWGASSNQFTPQVISQRASSGLVTMILEAGLIQLVFYLLGKRTLHILQLLAYMGYIFVPATAVLLASILFGNMLYWIILIYGGFSFGTFFSKSIALSLHSHDSDTNDITHNPHEMRERYFLLGLAFLQFFVLFFVSMH